MSIEPLSDGLLRQRRNLISICCVLVFMKFAGVSIEHFSFFSIDFKKMENPSALFVALWVFYFYFTFRYYQYFAQEGTVNLRRYYYEDLENRVMKHVVALAKKIDSRANAHPRQLATLINENWRVRVTYPKKESGKDKNENEVEHIVFPKKSLYKHRAFTVFSISFNCSAATDYILPFLIALFTLAYCFCGSESSLVGAFKSGVA